MKKRILLPIKPMSINKVHCRDQRYLTTAFKDWSYNIMSIINNKQNKKHITELREYFDKKEHVIKMKISCFYPRSEFYTGLNQISSKTMDVSNTEKPLIDVLFLPKYCIGELENLKMDDKYIYSMCSEKKASDDYLIEVIIEIVSIDETETII